LKEKTTSGKSSRIQRLNVSNKLRKWKKEEQRTTARRVQAKILHMVSGLEKEKGPTS